MYTITARSNFIVTEGIKSPFAFFLNDKPSTNGQELLAEYLSDARGIFKSECDILLATDHDFTDENAKRLTIMLRLLMDARKTWQEEADTIANKHSV
jgi:hypothetical protein